MPDKLVRTSVVVSFFLLAALFAGCGARQSRLTASDNGSIVSLAPGEILVLELPSNPTTGYSWQIMQVDSLVLRLTGEPEYRPDSNAQGLVGSGGTQVFRFEAGASGETALTLGYARPWEETEPPLETFAVRVLVR